MSKATRSKPPARRPGQLLSRMVNGSLIAAGLLAVVHQGLQHQEARQVSFADTGMKSASVSGVTENPHPPSATALAVGINEVAAQEARADTALETLAGLPPMFTLPLPELRAEGELSAEMQRVRDWVARRYRVSDVILEPVLAQAEDSANQAGLDPLLIVAVMAIESGFNPFAESRQGAQGLMQVIPRYHKDKIGEDAREDALFDPLLNVRVGTQVLAEGMRRFGTMQGALQYYAGALKDPNAGYTKKVLALKQRIRTAARAGDA